MSLVSVTKFSRLLRASVAEQASLSLTWSETPEDTSSHDEAHIVSFLRRNDNICYKDHEPSNTNEHALVSNGVEEIQPVTIILGRWKY